MKQADFKQPDLQRLLDDKVPEGTTIEYKSILDLCPNYVLSNPANKPKNKRLEFLADVIQFANSPLGGVIVFGINEDDGEPSGFAKQTDPSLSLDALQLQISDALL